MPHEPEDDLTEMITLTMEGREALALGEPVKALELLRKKHALVIRNFGENSVYAATSAVDFGEALLGCGEYEEAGELLRWSATRYRELNIDDDRVLRAIGGAAMAAYQAADYGSAEAQFKALISDLESRGPDFRLRRAAEQDHLAQVMLRQGRYHEAEPLLIEALSVFVQADPNGEDTGICLSMLGHLYHRTSRFREAEAAGRRALALFETAFGRNSTHVAKALDHVAMSLAMRAQSENKKELAVEAVSLGERAVKIFRANLPATHPSAFAAQRNLNGYQSLYSSIGMMYPTGANDYE